MPDNVAANALSSIWGSKRALLAVVLIVAVSVLAALSVITAQQWIDYTKWIFTVWVSGESVTAAAQHFANAKSNSTEVTATYTSKEPAAPPPTGAVA